MALRLVLLAVGAGHHASFVALLAEGLPLGDHG